MAQSTLRSTNVTKHKCLPLCYPNNYEWDGSSGKLRKMSNCVETTKLVVLQEALDLIAEIQEPMCVVGIVGDRRTGKSYMISQLQEPPSSECVFSIAAGMRANTVGIWMSTQIFKRKLTDGTEVAVLLIDSEGLGSTETMGSGDNDLFTLTVLITSVLIYNGIGVAKADDLQKLRCVGDLATHIQVRSEDGKGGATMENQNKEFFEFFPSFVWLLRDVSLIPKLLKNGEEVKVGIREYIVEEVLLRKITSRSFQHEHPEKHADIGKAILSFFPVFECFTLPAPSVDPEVIENIEKPEYQQDINRKFLSQKETFCELIRNMMKPKKAWPQVGNVTGWQLSELIKQYVAALASENCNPNIESTWDQILKLQMKRDSEEALNVYKEEMATFMEISLPCEENVLNEYHKQAYGKATSLFERRTSNIRNAAVLAEAFRDLKDEIAIYSPGEKKVICGLLYGYITKNEEASELACTQLADNIFKEHITPLTDEKLDSFHQVERAVKFAVETYRLKAKGPKAQSILIERLSKKITEFYFDNVDVLRNLKGFKSPELTKEEARQFEDRIRALEAHDKIKAQEEMMQQMKESAENQIKMVKEAMKQQEEQREKDREMLLMQLKRQEEEQRHNESLKEIYEEKIQEIEKRKAKESSSEGESSGLSWDGAATLFTGAIQLLGLLAAEPTSTSQSSGGSSTQNLSYHQCDKCLSSPILGVRYRCQSCPDYDLCEKCYRTEGGHFDHKFTRVVKPAFESKSSWV